MSVFPLTVCLSFSSNLSLLSLKPLHCLLTEQDFSDAVSQIFFTNDLQSFSEFSSAKLYSLYHWLRGNLHARFS